MSISEQVKELRELAEKPEIDMYGILSLQNACRQAANTIETLTIKLEKEHIRNKWHLFNERLPNNGQKVIVSKYGETLEDLFEFCVPDSDCENVLGLKGFLYGECHDGITVLNTNENELAWMPLPKSNINAII